MSILIFSIINIFISKIVDIKMTKFDNLYKSIISESFDSSVIKSIIFDVANKQKTTTEIINSVEGDSDNNLKKLEESNNVVSNLKMLFSKLDISNVTNDDLTIVSKKEIRDAVINDKNLYDSGIIIILNRANIPIYLINLNKNIAPINSIINLSTNDAATIDDIDKNGKFGIAINNSKIKSAKSKLGKRSNNLGDITENQTNKHNDKVNHKSRLDLKNKIEKEINQEKFKK